MEIGILFHEKGRGWEEVLQKYIHRTRRKPHTGYFIGFNIFPEDDKWRDWQEHDIRCIRGRIEKNSLYLSKR